MTTHDNAPPPEGWRPETRVPSFHNTCEIEVRSIAAAWCVDHGVRVYRDGTDWCAKPGKSPRTRDDNPANPRLATEKDPYVDCRRLGLRCVDCLPFNLWCDLCIAHGDDHA